MVRCLLSCTSAAWDDGAIRAFTPETGRLVCEILGAHRSGVSALGITSSSDRIISGGKEGQVRIVIRDNYVIMF